MVRRLGWATAMLVPNKRSAAANSRSATRMDFVSVVSRLEQLCQDKGLKMTEQRRVIARVLSEADDHPDVEQLYRRATNIDPGISLATVYRTVRLFEEASILERHDFGDGRARYEEAPADHHDHLIDIQSGE